MRKLTFYLLLAGLTATPVLGADGITPSRVVTGTDGNVITARRTQNNTVSRGTVARTAANPEKTDDTSARTKSNTNTSVSERTQNVVSRPNGTSDTTKTGTTSRDVNAITGANRTQKEESVSTRERLDTATNTVGRNARTDAASINSDPSVRRAGLVLRPSVAEFGGRAKISGTDIQTGSNITANTNRGVTARSAESISDARAKLEQTAELNKSCQQQYNECMDQFCAVIDTNQKRCSCSANLNRYTKVEAAVKDANTQLNDVAQRIRYVGLSADEIRAIMNATEAEEVLTSSSDTTETRNMLEEIEKLIKDPTSSTTYTADTFSGLDMSLDFSTDGDDLFNLDFLNTNSSSFSNLRGSDLYNAAKKRCNTILTRCKSAGATVQQITGNYDLEIDKDCVAYEKGLTKMNDTLVSNVRSANLMLQKARLAVLQNKNQYDAKGCIAALDACMTDDMVCGDDYFKCIDPTKMYIDENGEVILGKNITDITDFMSAYNNANINAEFLTTAETTSIATESCKATNGNGGQCIAKYLLQKIGTGDKVTDGGLCRAVLDRCQYYTYDDDGKYMKHNDVVVNYIQRAMVNIRAAQQKIISEYASSCILDIASCYNQQVTQVNTWSNAASTNSIYNVMRGACRNVALTCAYAVFDGDEASCPTGNTQGTTANPDACIENISKMFYQSLLCPENSQYDADGVSASEVLNNGLWVNTNCKCIGNYVAYNGACLVACGTNEERGSLGTCVCKSGYEKSDGVCVVKQ